MNIGTANVDACNAFGQITIRIRLSGLKRAKLRLMIAILLFKFGGLVSPSKVEVSID